MMSVIISGLAVLIVIIIIVSLLRFSMQIAFFLILILAIVIGTTFLNQVIVYLPIQHAQYIVVTTEQTVFFDVTKTQQTLVNTTIELALTQSLKSSADVILLIYCPQTIEQCSADILTNEYYEYHIIKANSITYVFNWLTLP
jgi:ABC-type antimicrobial peptide transport system ATPase subunit